MNGAGLIHDLKVVTWGQPVLDAGIDVGRSASKSLSGEFFVLLEEGGVGVIREAWQGRRLPGAGLVTAHPQSVDQIQPLIEGTVARSGLYGQLAPTTTPRQFIHSKTLVVDGDDVGSARAWVSTGSFSNDTKWRWEAAGVFGGRPARAVHHLAELAVSGDLAYQRTAIQRAAAEGVFVNDPVTGNRGLTEAIEGLVANEPTSLTVAMKSMFDEQFAAELAARHVQHGVEVRVIAKRIDEPSERILREAGVTLMKPDASKPEIHGNAIIAHGLGQAYLGTAYASPRTLMRADVPNLYAGGGRLLNPSAQWERSRELGLLTDSRGGIDDLLRGIDELGAAPHDFRDEVIRPVQGAIGVRNGIT